MKKFIFFSTIFFFYPSIFWKGAEISAQNNNVGIGTLNPAASALLDIDASPSNNKGVLIPRLTTAQRLAIPSPANGLLVFDSNLDCFYFYSNITVSWTSLCTGVIGSTGATGVIGNIGISGSTGVIGNTGTAGNIGVTGATGPSGGPPGPTGPMGTIGLAVFQYVSGSAIINPNTDIVIITGAPKDTMFLPPCTSMPVGKVIIFKKIFHIASTYNYYINSAGSDMLEQGNYIGASNLIEILMSNPTMDVCRLVSDGVSTWYVW